MTPELKILLGIDTCGPSGSVALGRFSGQTVEILGQTELEGRNYSATLVAAVGDLLASQSLALREVDALVAVNGPGSFTGVRVGLSAVKGLAEPTRMPVVAVSRLEVLAAKAGVPGSGVTLPGLCAALDAHRHEVFLRLGAPEKAANERAREVLAGAEELAAIHPAPARVVICEDAAAALLRAAWPETELLRVPAPTAADALRLGAPRVVAGQFVDLALLDGNYLRRSDAEIFGARQANRPAAPAHA